MESNDRRLFGKRGGLIKAALLFAIFLLAALALAWMAFFPLFVASELERRTNFEISSESIYCNPFGFDLRLKEVGIGNPIEFEGDSRLFQIESLTIATDFASLIDESTLTIHQIDLEVSSVTLVITERGELNLKGFCSRLENGVLAQGKKLVFPNARLRVGRVEIIDLSSARNKRAEVQMDLDVEGYRANGLIDLFRPLLRAIDSRGDLPSVSARATL